MLWSSSCTDGDSFGFGVQMCDLLDSLECPGCSILVGAQAVYFNLDPMGYWSTLQLCVLQGCVLTEFHVGKGKKDQRWDINPQVSGE